jgi:hypothetical protein
VNINTKGNKMGAQKPAEGILKTSDWGDSKAYDVVCQCSDPNHTHHLWVEAEDTGITVTIYSTVKSPWWSMNRFKQIWTLLTKGYLEHETNLAMNEQTALNYSETLKLAIQDVKTFKKSRA